MVNPASEKPKIGRGVLTKEQNGVKDRKVDKCLSPRKLGTEHGLFIFYCLFCEVLFLKELGEYLEPKVGKSGVNHRLRKLSELADRLKT